MHSGWARQTEGLYSVREASWTSYG
jgi:hypothetical protein